jgi:hypothetical protein
MFYRHANLQRTYESKIILEEISRKMFPFLKQSIKKFALKWFGNLGLTNRLLDKRSLEHKNTPCALVYT